MDDWSPTHLPGPNGHHRVSLGPLPLDPVDLTEAMARIEQAIDGSRGPLHVVTANTQFLGLARKDSRFAALVAGADLVVPDGMPLLWLSRLQRTPLPQRITGHDLLHATVTLAAQKRWPVGFLGGGPGVAEAAAERLSSLYPGLLVAGTFRGRFDDNGIGVTADDEEGIVEALEKARPAVLFVALGCPKQELWIAHHQGRTGIPVCVGVGGVLDVLAGRFRRAPQWMQRAGLEWLYRFTQEPLRLGRRYLLQDVPTLTSTAMTVLRSRARGRRMAT